MPAFGTSHIPPAKTSETIELIQDIIIPELNFTENVELADVCSFLETKTADLDPKEKGIKFKMSPEIQDLIRRGRDYTINAKFRNAHVVTILNTLCYIRSLDYSVEDDTVTFKLKRSN